MINTLSQAIFGKTTAASEPEGTVEIMALSDGLVPEQALMWRSLTSLEPPQPGSASDTCALGIFAGPEDDYILARAVYQPETQMALYQYVNLPADVYQQLVGDLSQLLVIMDTPIPAFTTPADMPIPPLELHHQPTWSIDKQMALFQPLYSHYDDPRLLLSLLGAAVDDQRLLIQGFDGDCRQRIELIQGLMMLIPSGLRAELTFATHVTEADQNTARVVFTDTALNTSRWIADFGTGTVPNGELLNTPFVAILASLWKNDIIDFFMALKPLEFIAPYFMMHGHLRDNLEAIADRYMLDMRVLSGDIDISPETLKSVLTSDIPLNNNLLMGYCRSLLTYALSGRDTEAASIVAHIMDTNPNIDEALSTELNEALQDQPDAVYVFARTRLSESVDEKWLPRLRAAALCSLEVAIKDGDSATLSSWLRLIAREPTAYHLGDLLHEGILAAQSRTHDDGNLGRQLILLAVKRNGRVIDVLLDDQELLAQLPEEFGAALRDYNPEAILSLLNVGREIFIVGLVRAMRLQAADVFTPAAIDAFWKIYTGEPLANLPENYQPESIIHEWTENGLSWLATDSIETLLTLILADERDDLFYQLTHHLGEHEVLFPLLATVLQRSQRTVNAVLGLIGQLVTTGDITQQQAVNTYIALLAAWDWDRDALPLVEQMGRMIQQNPALTITSEVGWRLLDIASDTKSELIARVAARRLESHLEMLPEETELVDHLVRLENHVKWSPNIRQFVINWWRDFARQQPLVNLQQIDKALEGKRALEPARNIVQTAIAMRRMLGKRSLEDFALDVSTAYNILQALIDSFDPSPKHSLNFDPPTVRAELDARQEELTPQERKLLAKNLKELAQLVTMMADNRSKPSLMRREEEVERQLTTGEQQPQSAIDAMRWMSGYFDGAQDKQEENAE